MIRFNDATSVPTIMIYLFKTIFFIIIGIFSLSAKAEIFRTKDSGIIRDEIAKLKNGDMVLFDVKHVLFHTNDQVMLSEHKWFFKQQFSQIEKNLGKEKAIRLKSIVLSSYKLILVDDKIPKIINKAQNFGIVALALTSGDTGNYGVIPNRANLRIQTLKEIGIDFSKSIDLPYINLDDDKNLLETNNNNHPIFQDGVIFTARKPKGKILSKFLNLSKLNPQKIIFIDNNFKNLILVEKKCKELGIDYVGIHFTKSYKQFPNRQLDKKIAEKKFKILLEQNRWIDDDEATALTKK